MIDPVIEERAEQLSVRARLRCNLTVQVLAAISLGVLLGAVAPDWARQ